MAKSTDKAAQAVGKVRGMVKGPLRGYTGIFHTLAEEHGLVSALMSKVSGSNDPDFKRVTFRSIREELLAHAHAEEREFYSMLRDNASTRGLVEHARDEHGKIERLIADLGSLDCSDAAWSARFETLRELVLDHVQEEEHDLFPLAKETLTTEQLKDVAQRYARAKEAHA